MVMKKLRLEPGNDEQSNLEVSGFSYLGILLSIKMPTFRQLALYPLNPQRINAVTLSPLQNHLIA
jgi:hypothetical protein